ncbi:hypothetical protein GHT06_008777 [Daphnia sinensis]|uniref:Uncharacterized protein n=1 Tax=Daphnia sinensis TaxID=1820382 RepID=A0AAD5Q0Z7_9CRUS|nr:hypothetical protein GHT06_008777 [Daphnia sinensis]
MANNSVRGSSRWTNKMKAIRLADEELEKICQSVTVNVRLVMNTTENSVQVNLLDVSVLPEEDKSVELSEAVEAHTVMSGSNNLSELDEDDEHCFLHANEPNDNDCFITDVCNIIQVSTSL